MASSLVEQTRLVHQDLEKHMEHMVRDLLLDNRTAKDRILVENRVSMRLEQMVVAGKALTEFYDDGDGSARRTELDEMAGTEVFSTFYDKLKGIRDYYKQYPDQLPQQQDYDVKPKVQFSGSEVGGTFVDLFVLFERFINMPMFTRIDYLTFLNSFSDFAQVSRAQKFLPFHYPQYKSYLTDLRSYLIDFQQRTNPLAETKVLLDLVKTEFDAQWAEQAVAGWGAVEAVAATSSEQAADPLYCTDCCKQFSSTSTYTSHLSGRKHKKSMKTDSTKVDVTADPRAEELARLEFDVKAFADMLRPVVEATRDYVVKKQTRTYEEIAADLEEQAGADEVSSSDSDDDEAVISNPLNLPLGWDGKPIPFWLYKLHGLNVEYKCDICGGFTYRGPRAFERHFSEWRHTYGMRCLGIPNSKDFLHVTKFEDAIALHEKLQSREATSSWKAEDEEEFEDDEGNVFNKKTYEDLKRQGII